MRDFARLILVLFVACGLAAASLAVVNMVTRERIALWEQKQKETALRSVCRNADEFKEVTTNRVWEARLKGQKVGYAFLTQIQGYSGAITLMFGIDDRNAVTGLEILSHTETPGLGAKITTPAFRDQFRNRKAEALKLKKDDPHAGQIDAITGATISSRAVTRAISTAIESFQKAQTGDNP
jgi:electron transport complex protein RnfG